MPSNGVISLNAAGLLHQNSWNSQPIKFEDRNIFQNNKKYSSISNAACCCCSTNQDNAIIASLSLLEHTAQCSTLVWCCKVHCPILCSSTSVAAQNVLRYLLNAFIQTPSEDTESDVRHTFPQADIISPILVHFFPLIQSSECYVTAWTIVGTLRKGRMLEKYLWNTIKLQLQLKAAAYSVLR